MKILVFLFSLLLVGSASAQTPEMDFVNRCSAAGVVKCYGFDDPAVDLVQGKLTPDGLKVYRTGQDTTVKASGVGSLVFTLPPPPHGGPNIAGSWTSGVWPQTFSENSTFYVQYRVKFSPEMFTNTWPANNSWKIAILHHNAYTCGNLELTNINRYRTDVLAAYTNCGALSLFANPTTGLFTKTTPLLLQQGDYPCNYSNQNPNDCFYLKPNQWLTLYYKVSIGTWKQPNSTIDIYVHKEGEANYKQIVKMPNYTFTCNLGACDVNPGKATGFNNLTFTPYMTGLSPNAGLPEVTARVWYDELIVSTQPIAAPMVSRCYQ